MRLFVSLPLPPAVAEHLALAVRSVTDLDPDPLPGRGRPALRWTPPEQRHITLAFYGEVPDGAAEDLAGDLRTAVAQVAPPRLRLRGSGVFSGRTLWAGVQDEGGRGHSEQAGELTRLMGLCEEVGARYAAGGTAVAERDRRRAHVTLARTRDRRIGERELRRRAQALSVYEGPAWTAEVVLLVRSELGAGRDGTALHAPEAEIPLGA